MAVVARMPVGTVGAFLKVHGDHTSSVLAICAPLFSCLLHFNLAGTVSNLDLFLSFPHVPCRQAGSIKGNGDRGI